MSFPHFTTSPPRDTNTIHTLTQQYKRSFPLFHGSFVIDLLYLSGLKKVSQNEGKIRTFNEAMPLDCEVYKLSLFFFSSSLGGKRGGGLELVIYPTTGQLGSDKTQDCETLFN